MNTIKEVIVENTLAGLRAGDDNIVFPVVCGSNFKVAPISMDQFLKFIGELAFDTMADTMKPMSIGDMKEEFDLEAQYYHCLRSWATHATYSVESREFTIHDFKTIAPFKERIALCKHECSIDPLPVAHDDSAESSLHLIKMTPYELVDLITSIMMVTLQVGRLPSGFVEYILATGVLYDIIWDALNSAPEGSPLRVFNINGTMYLEDGLSPFCNVYEYICLNGSTGKHSWVNTCGPNGVAENFKFACRSIIRTVLGVWLEVSESDIMNPWGECYADEHPASCISDFEDMAI
jgi:hypothetical protein